MHEPSDRELSLADIPRSLLRHKGLFLAVFLAVAAAALGASLVLPKVYRATTVILLERQVVPEQYVGSLIAPRIEDRLRLLPTFLTSETLLKKVIANLTLIPDLYDPLAVQRLIATLRDGIESKVSGTDALHISYEGPDPQAAMRITNELANLFIEDYLTFSERMIGGTSEFLNQELRETEGGLAEQERRIMVFRRRHIDELPEQLDSNQRALDRLQGQLEATNKGLAEAKYKEALARKEVADLEAAWADKARRQRPEEPKAAPPDPLEAQVEGLEKRLALVRARYTDRHPDVGWMRREVEEARGRLADQRRRAEQAAAPPKPTPGDADAGGKAKPDQDLAVHPTYLSLQSQIQQSRRDSQSLEADRQRLLEKLEVYQARVENAPKRQQELLDLTRGYDVLRDRYRTLLERKLDAQVSIKLEGLQKDAKFRILDPATLPVFPIRPRRWLIAGLGLLAGLGLGLGTAVAAELMDSSVRVPKDLVKPSNAPVLAWIPRIAPEGRAGGRRVQSAVAKVVFRKPAAVAGASSVEVAAEQGLDASEPGGSAQAVDPMVIAYADRHSIAAEQYRTLRTHLKILMNGAARKRLLITSAVGREGKTLTAANLAVTLAYELNQRVLLVDGDLRRPNLHRLFGLGLSPGLAELLNGRVPVEGVLRPGPVGGLTLLPAGEPPDNPVELVAADRTRSVLDDLRARFDVVLMDSPPVLPVTDASVLSGLADGVILVARAGFSQRESVAEALGRLRGARLIGVVLNDVRDIEAGYGYSYARYAGRGSGR